MPFVEVHYDAKKVPEKSLALLQQGLRLAVAVALTVDEPDGDLVETDVALKFTPFGKYDVWTHDVAVIVVANTFPKREADKGQAKARIQQLVTSAVGSQIRSYTWINLVSGAFVENVPVSSSS